MSSARVAVIGGGVAGMVAALECAKLGLRVVLFEKDEFLGGCLGRGVVGAGAGAGAGAISVDIGAESFATKGDAVVELISALGRGDGIVVPAAGGSWLAFHSSAGKFEMAPMPRSPVLGIPISPLSADVRRVIGWSGALRAYFDRLRPLLRIGLAHGVADLVRERMGNRVLDRLVQPLAEGVYGVNVEDIDLTVVAPGLNGAMTRAGSLSGGVALFGAELAVMARERSGVVTGPVAGIRGGMHRLVDALQARLQYFDVGLRTSSSIHSLMHSPASTDTWILSGLEQGEPFSFTADYLILASSVTGARTLLGSLPGYTELFADWPEPNPVELVTLFVEAPELDSAPRGSGLLVARGVSGVRAKAATHASAKWPWLAELCGPGRHIVRLSYGRPGDEFVFSPDVDVLLADLNMLFGLSLTSAAIIDLIRTSWPTALTPITIGHSDRVAAFAAKLSDVPTLGVTGVWLAGMGLAATVPHAVEVAHRIRRLALHN